MVPACTVLAQSELRPLRMSAKQLAFHPQDVRTPPAMASDSHLGSTQPGASLDHLLAHLESSKQALEHQVQQLLQENRLSKSAKKEQQWHMEGEKLHSKLDSLNAALMEKEDRIRLLERELRDARGNIRDVVEEKERGDLERASMRAHFEDAQSNFRNLDREYKMKQDVAAQQRRALASLANKVEQQKESFQSQLEDVSRKLMESEEREQKYELAARLASQHMAEKERQLKALRDAHEKLLVAQKGKQAEERHEVKEVILALESTHVKCEEKKALIKELEQELGRIRKEAHHLDARVAAAEADSSSKTSILEKVQLELKNTSSHAALLAKAKSQTEDLKTQVETLKRNLQDVENTLSEESALRFKAECALNEYKVREKSFLKIENDGKVLQEEVKWRNEQFESLEEAHNKMRDQFHEGLSMWASEKASILKDIEVLTENVQSRDIAIHDLRSQGKLLEQSLAHEENCRKLLEFQLADAKAGMESVSAEYLTAQSILESLRENSKNEMAFLKDTLAEKDCQLKELHLKQTQIDRDQKELMELQAELDTYKHTCEQLQQTIEKGSSHEEIEVHLKRDLADAEATIAKKEVEMKELEMELDRTRTLSELLRTSLSEAEENRMNSEAIQTLEKLSASLSAKEQHAMELQIESNNVRECNAEAERRITVLEDRLRDAAHTELQAKSNDLRDTERFELDKVLVESEREQSKQLFQRERQELLTKLEHLTKQCTLKDTQLNDLLDQIEREKVLISTLEARCASSEQEFSKQLLQIREELVAEKMNARVYQERAQVLDASLNADAAAKDASLKEIKDTLYELTVLCKGDSAQAATRISSIEAKLEKQDVLEGRPGSLLTELNAVVGEVERIAQGVAYLNIELTSLKDDSKLTKTEFETRLRAVEGLFSSSFVELKEVSEQVGKMSAERISLVDILNKKEGDVDLLNKENNSLSIEKTNLEANTNILQAKLLQLVKEAESNKAIIDTLNVNMKSAEEHVATRSGELHKLVELSETKNSQLLSIAEQSRALERKLQETEEIVHDKEQRLAASEWAVQQLASEIAKSKSYLAQKEKDESAFQDRLEHFEEQLKAKERELLELQCDLENAVKASNEKHALVQEFTLSKQEMGHVLEFAKRALEEKTATLVTSEAEIKRLLEIQRLTEEALATCKERLSNELKTNVAREKDMKRLCEDIEKSNQEASLADVDVKSLQERLKCLERTTEARLESCERKMEKGAADLAEYQENCAGLLALIEKKDAIIHQLQMEVTHTHKELEKELMLTEQNAQELHFVSEQLQSKTKMHSNLKVELATVDVLVKELETQKRELEEEVRTLKSSLSVATRDVKEKVLEIEQLDSRIEQLESLISQQGDAHAVKSKELQITSNAVEERDSKLSKLQSSLTTAQDELQKAHELVAMKESEKRVLSLRLSELESRVEKGQSQISQLQSSLQLARGNLEAETERVWHQVAARNEIETELDAWKAKAAEFESHISKLQTEMKDWKEVAEHTQSLTGMELDAWKMRVTSLTENHATMQAEFESSQAEVKEWKEVAEKTQHLNAELQNSMQAMVDWEKSITSLADEGDEAKLHLEVLLKQVHVEFRSLHADLTNSKDLMAITRTLKAEFLSTVQDSQALQKQTELEREEYEMTSKHLQADISDLERELSVWKTKALNSSATSETVSLQEAQLQLNKWRQRAEEWESCNKILEQAFSDFEHTFLEQCKADTEASENDLKMDIQASFRNLRKEVEEAKSEMLEAEETKREFEGCVNSLQAEVDVWKQKAAVATEESLQMRNQFEDLLKNLQSELKNWKQFEALDSNQTVSESNDSTRVTIAMEGELESRVFTPNSINPFHQEDEGCWEAHDNDDAATQLDGWKTKSSFAAREGRKLTRQFRASFKHLQQELESRKQAPKMVSKHGSFVHRHDDTGLEDLVKALQEEAVEIKAELADWKSKAHETGTLKDELELTISKLKAEVEGWKDRSAMSAGQRIVARRQLDDFAKQVKSLNTELQKWKDVATESNEGSTKLQNSLERVQNENEDMKSELNEWMRKSLELNCVIKDLEKSVTTRNHENQLQIDELEHEVERWKVVAAKAEVQIEELEQLRAEVERWKTVAAKAEEEGELAKMELLDTLGKFEDELEVMSSNSIGGCSTAEGRSFKEEDLDCSWQTSGRIANEWRHELEVSLQAEVEDWKTKVASVEKEQEDLRQTYETTVKELQARKKNAECIAEEGRLERVELEKKLQDFEATDLRNRSSEVQAELQIWKKRATDAATECTSLRDAYENVITELAQWKEKSETATEECKSVRTDLENTVQELQHQVHVWKQKAEEALENVVKNQEYEDLIKALEEELCLWAQRTQESKFLQLQLENEQVHLKESLTATQNELQKWKDKAAAVTTSLQSRLQEECRTLTTIPEEDEDEVNIDPLSDDEEDEVSLNVDYESQQLQKWKSEAEHGELLQLQLEDLLAETQTELNEWKQKAADFSLAAEFLKEELECIIEEGRLEKEELVRSTAELEDGLRLWRERAQESEAQLENSKTALQKWEEKAVNITQSTRSLMEEFDLTIEEGQLEKQEFYASINALKASVVVWKEKVAEGESMELELKATLLETQTELQEWKDRAAVAIATKPSQTEINEHNRQLLCNTITELEAELVVWKSRAQEGVSVQLQLEKNLSDMEQKAATAATNTQSLKEELDRTIADSSSEILELCNAITALETELKESKSETSRFPQLLQLQNELTETQSQLQEWQEKATVASQAEEELRQAVEEIRAETGKLDNFIRALKDELLEWKEKAEHLETLQIQLTSSLASSEQELQLWKQKGMNPQEGEFLHQQRKKSVTETETEIQDLREKLAAFNLCTESLKDELKSANELASKLTTQVNTQKQNEESLQKLNRQLEGELVLARDEAFSRKQKMVEILAQLEGSSNSQKELQHKLLRVQHRLLENEKLLHHSQDESVNHLTAASKANLIGSDDDIHDVVSYNAASPETEVPSKSQNDSRPSESEGPGDKLKSDILRGKNPALDKMRQELFSLKSLVSKLEHVRGSDDSEQSLEASTDEVEETVIPRAASLLSREDEELDKPEVLLQSKQVESSKAVQESGVHPQRKGNSSDALNRSRSHSNGSVARFKVLADVNGNSPRATSANHSEKLHVESRCPPDFSRLSRV